MYSLYLKTITNTVGTLMNLTSKVSRDLIKMLHIILRSVWKAMSFSG